MLCYLLFRCYFTKGVLSMSEWFRSLNSNHLLLTAVGANCEKVIQEAYVECWWFYSGACLCLKSCTEEGHQ
jgi:hypothetical protein